MDLTLQEQELINLFRRKIAYERIEIMKDKEGNLGSDIIISRATKQRIKPTGDIVGLQLTSVLIKSDEWTNK